jgi:hypothetical protein
LSMRLMDTQLFRFTRVKGPLYLPKR